MSSRGRAPAGMENRLLAQTFSFDQEFKPYHGRQLCLDFFQNDDITRSIKMPSSSGAVSYGIGAKAATVEIVPVPCAAVSMSLFDRLEPNDIVQESGYIRKCLEEYVDGVPLSDELRNVLLNEEFEKYDIYTEEEREQFLFRLFSHLCIGGGICQYEDVITPYIQHTKLLYKDLVSVQKEPGSSDIHVISQVFKVKAMDEEGDAYFPDDKDHMNSFCYLIVNPVKRHVTIFHHKYGGGVW